MRCVLIALRSSGPSAPQPSSAASTVSSSRPRQLRDRPSTAKRGAAACCSLAQIDDLVVSRPLPLRSLSLDLHRRRRLVSRRRRTARFRRWPRTAAGRCCCGGFFRCALLAGGRPLRWVGHLEDAQHCGCRHTGVRPLLARREAEMSVRRQIAAWSAAIGSGRVQRETH